LRTSKLGDGKWTHFWYSFAGARGSTHKTIISALKNLYTIPKTLIEPMVSQLNTNAIKYAMNILLYKRKLENNQPVPTIPN
jgi:hypothetical protein